MEAIAVNLQDSWSEHFFSKVDSSLAQYEDFRCGKRYKGLKTRQSIPEKSALATVRKLERFAEACIMS